MLTRASLLVCLFACAPPSEPDLPAVDSSSPPPDAGVEPPLPDADVEAFADPSLPGPYLAGVRTIELTDPSRDRTFKVDVWYPAAPDGEDNTYDLDSPFGTLASIDSPARRDATPLAGAWPLVVFSHGFGGVRFQSYFLTERLATHGFVVAGPDHPGNTLSDFQQLGDDDAGLQSSIDRPLDVIFTLDRMLDGTAGVAVTIDPARIGITGHSFGAWTALEVSRRDPRFTAVFPMAPGFRNGSTPDFVAELGRPLLLIGGSEDQTCEFPANQQVPYDLAQPPKALLRVNGAGHLDFSNLCEVAVAQAFIDDGCDPDKIDPEIVHARVLTVSTAFVRRYLDGDDRYESTLDPAFVSGLGNVDYWRNP